MAQVAGVRFKKACKVYDFDCSGTDVRPGDTVVVEVEKGLGMGTVVYSPREVDYSKYNRQLKRIVRKADPVDIERHSFNTERENEAFRICREKIVQYNLPMKLIRVEYLFDSSKAIFYFTAETRVDFRELVKDLASSFHTRIEMRQVGVRDEAKMVGGLGPCGRELCCTGFLSDFAPVTIKMAKEQNLALNPAKISGICGRLMCCLAYEHAHYKGAKPQKKKEGCGGCPGHGEEAAALAADAAKAQAPVEAPGAKETGAASLAQGERKGGPGREGRHGRRRGRGGRRDGRPPGGKPSGGPGSKGEAS